MAPSEFWELSPTEFWWEFDAKVRAVKRLDKVTKNQNKSTSAVDWEAARKEHKAKMERLKNGDRNQ